jgi:hypothetical protein
VTQDKLLVLQLNGGEIAALKAVIATALDESRRSDGPGSAVCRRLEALQSEASRLTSQGTLRLPLERDDAELLRAYTAMVMGISGYMAGRPNAIVSLTSLRTTVDRLLKGSRWHEMRQGFGEIMHGIFVYDSVRLFRKQETSLEHLFVLVSFGDLLGVPVLPPFYTLRLLPYVVPLINGWRRRMLREKDYLDSLF